MNHKILLLLLGVLFFAACSSAVSPGSEFNEPVIVVEEATPVTQIDTSDLDSYMKKIRLAILYLERSESSCFNNKMMEEVSLIRDVRKNYPPVLAKFEKETSLEKKITSARSLWVTFTELVVSYESRCGSLA